MALLKAKQLDVTNITALVLHTITTDYTSNYTFNNLVDGVNTFSTGYHFPIAPQNLELIAVNANSATLHWNPTLLAISYNVYCHPKGDPLHSIILLNVIGTTVTISGLSQDTVYEVEVTPNLS
jgi:hypothetical protein